MPLSPKNRRADGKKKPQTVGLIVVIALILLETVLPALIRWVRYGLVYLPSATVGVTVGGALSVFAAALAVIGVTVILLLAVSRRKKRGSFRRDDDELMHDDHYHRTEHEYPHYSADPCSYSEHYSRRRSRCYDDPWDI